MEPKRASAKAWQYDIVYSPDGTQIAIGSSIGIWLYDANTRAEIDLLTGHTGIVWSVAYSPDGGTLASGGGRGDGTIRLWDANTGEHKQTLEGHTDFISSVAFSPDGSTLASGSGDKTIRLWDTTTGRQRWILEGHTSWIKTVAFSPDGGTLASGAAWQDKTIRLWDTATGKHKQTLEGHTDYINSVTFSPEGSTLASGAAWQDKTIRLWDTATGKHKQAPLRGIDVGFWRLCIPRMGAHSPVQVGMAQFGYGMLPPENISTPLKGIRMRSIQSRMPRMVTSSSVGVLERYICGMSPPADMSRFSRVIRAVSPP